MYFYAVKEYVQTKSRSSEEESRQRRTAITTSQSVSRMPRPLYLGWELNWQPPPRKLVDKASVNSECVGSCQSFLHLTPPLRPYRLARYHSQSFPLRTNISIFVFGDRVLQGPNLGLRGWQLAPPPETAEQDSQSSSEWSRLPAHRDSLVLVCPLCMQSMHCSRAIVVSISARGFTACTLI